MTVAKKVSSSLQSYRLDMNYFRDGATIGQVTWPVYVNELQLKLPPNIQKLYITTVQYMF